ncbi:MAG: hypothetical protein M0D57_08690 [Sphingobacteriales bacterium JAD_PAG50586_3]|nr:MAG: hypothetical protein M0D57_08690 [Sphingobacteriales bacterium JAD_PAG50586_3]
MHVWLHLLVTKRCPSTLSGWASECRKVNIGAPVYYGSLVYDIDYVCSPGDPAQIYFNTPPSGGSGNYTYQWYYQNGLVNCPTGSSTSGWTVISGANADNYNPPTGLLTSRTYACLVTATAGSGCAASSGWASQCRQEYVSG